MKNKKLTYFLGLVVLIVWGMIIYRIFNSTTESDEGNHNFANTVAKEPYNDYATFKDTTHLLLNYRDPFHLKKGKDTTLIERNVHLKSFTSRNVQPIINWNFIKYSGYIRNPGTKKLIALVNINGKNEMMSEGENVGNVKLIKNMRDSIKIIFKGKTKFIVMKSATL